MKHESPWLTQVFKQSFTLAIWLVVLLISSLSPPNISAQDNGPLMPGEELATNPKDRSTQVTAVVPVWQPPPVPVLISPSNNAVIRSREPTFEWEVQDHIAPYDYVDFLLEGERLFARLPFSNQETSDYILTVVDKTFKLTFKNTHTLNDGLHTWKVRVVDFHDHGTDSTTWSFTVDSQAPTILVTQVDEEATAISSADIDTIPTEPLVVTSAQPVLKGKTEPSIEVQLVITRSGWEDKTLLTKSDENGNFSFQLPWLEEDETVQLRFTTVDKAGNAAVLEGLSLVYKVSKVIVVVPPGIFPEPFILELPTLPEFWTWTQIHLPPPIAKVVEPIVEPVIKPTILFTDSIATFVHNFQGVLFFLWLIFWWLYFIVLHAQTGNPWKVWPGFLKHWFVALIKGWPEHPHLWREDVTGRPLPLLFFSVEVLNQTKQIEKRAHLTTLYGTWNEPIAEDELYSLQCPNHRYSYPTWRLKISEERDGTMRNLFISGESWYRAPQNGQKQTSADTFVLPELKDLRLVAWLRKAKAAPWPGWRYLPRLSLLVSLLLSLLLLIFAAKFLHVLLLLFVLGVLLRDVSWNVPEKWRSYFV